MSITITDGIALMPPAFAAGLSAWSSGDGRAGSDTYAGAGAGVLVPADADFGSCLEIVKTTATQRLRWTGRTPVLPGVYLRVSVRLKVLSGALPQVRVAGTPLDGAGAVLAGLPGQGPATAIPALGRVVTVSGIIARSPRTGVDLAWPGAVEGHLGIDLTGPTGSVIRIDDVTIEDATDVFLRVMLAQVDVRDFGAVGDGVTDDSAAFRAADAAAAGRVVLVPAGTFRLAQDVTLSSHARFQGTVTMPPEAKLVLQRDFHLNAYVDAFGSEETGFRRAWQALLAFADHESLDLCGRRIALTQPCDLQSADPARTSFATRRVIRNGQFQVAAGAEAAFADRVVTATATWSAARPTELAGLASAAAIPVGSLVTGEGVAREIYVRAVDAAAGTVTLSAPPGALAASQSYTFRRFGYLLDLSGYESLSQLQLADIDFLGGGVASGLMLARDGIACQIRDCSFTRPAARAITSIGTGCQGLLVDRCQFLSNEQQAEAEARTTVALNVNANDAKLRDNRGVLFRHFAVLGGGGHLISGNHVFGGDGSANGVRLGGLIFAQANPRSLVVGNYLDNLSLEWTNERDAAPAQSGAMSFGGLTVTGNLLHASNVAPWFAFLVVRPMGPGHFLDGLIVTGNVVRVLGAPVARIEAVDAAVAALDPAKARAVAFGANAVHGVVQEARNPATLLHAQATASATWLVDAAGALPFGGTARGIDTVQPVGRVQTAAGASVFDHPFAEGEAGAARQQVRLTFSQPVRGSARVTVRMDAG